jgi:hypothetical protein
MKKETRVPRLGFDRVIKKSKKKKEKENQKSPFALLSPDIKF